MKQLTKLLGIVVGLGLLTAVVFAGSNEDKSRAFLGVEAGEITSELAADYGVAPGNGVIVEGVTGGSPAEEVGLRSNDVIVMIDGNKITGPEEFRVQIRKHKPKDQIKIDYYRGGKEKSAAVTLDNRHENMNMAWGNLGGLDHDSKAPRAWSFNWNHDDNDGEKQGYAGLHLQELSDGLRDYFKVEDGVLISEVVAGSPADKAGLKAGDVILKVAGDAVDDESEIREEIRGHKPGESLEFTVKRAGTESTISVKLGSVSEGEDMGFNSIGTWDGMAPEFDIHIDALEDLKSELHSLEGLGDIEDLEDLKARLEDIEITIPMQLEIQPDAPSAPERIEIRKARPIWDRTVWLESWDRVKDTFSKQLDQANEGIQKLRAQLAELRAQIMERFA